ncbi:MAG: DUF4249 domain-containing protein [Phaeodactylibacter sp.]|nr:DUF4249 domain-containing protein [Phaeodactylibacter sp.]MCB9275610.1 DUF4249 domain-containing protein [Lewinellaceae bacterium]
MKNLLFIAFAILAFFSCEKTIELDLGQTEDAVVIEGLVTDKPGKQFIRISKVVPFNGSGQAPAVSGATVAVDDDEGNSYTFVEQQAGYYTPQTDFTGLPGRTYTMHVQAEGITYTASGMMHTLPPFDSLSIRVDEEERADPDEEGRFYEVLVYIDEPQETEDYYLLKFYRNDSLLTDNGSWVYVSSDEFLGGDIDALPIPYYYAQSDVARVEIYAISREGYKYYTDLLNNVSNDGGMFSGYPANVRTNIEGGAIGYFQVSGLSAAELEIKQ